MQFYFWHRGVLYYGQFGLLKSTVFGIYYLTSRFMIMYSVHRLVLSKTKINLEFSSLMVRGVDSLGEGEGLHKMTVFTQA